MSAASVSGLLALMQEFFQRQLSLTNFSPALMKALLINGARSAGPIYDLTPQNSLNIQGWGVPNITNSIPLALTNASDQTSWPVRFFDQATNRVLATGQRQSWTLKLSAAAQQAPLRVTLVWTDPPGNPAVGVKLVNDLDMVVTDPQSGTVYLGNDIDPGSDFNTARDPSNVGTNDIVNNVENVFLPAAGSSNLVISVIARRVNVNAVTANTNDVVQDYALVISSGNGDVDSPITELTALPSVPAPPPTVTTLTNGAPLLHERVGANFPLTNVLGGEVSQWNFYVFTNSPPATNSAAYTNSASVGSITNGSNVVFATFLPPNLGLPRATGADVDLYVSTNSALTNLDPVVLASADKSVGRGGTEFVFYTNAPLGQVYYVGVKSEDQQGAEYAFIGLSSNIPFDQRDAFGNFIVQGQPLHVPIPDGSAAHPGGVLIFALATQPMLVQKVIVNNVITHPNIGDLLGNVSHSQKFVVLNNHTLDNGNTNLLHTFVYDDSSSGQTVNSIHTDGPGSLNDFIGEQGQGLWLLTMVDNSPGFSGVEENFSLLLQPSPLGTPTGVHDTVQGNRENCYFIDVPATASQLNVLMSDMSGPLNVYVRREQLPTSTLFDKSALMTPTSGTLTLGLRDVPPLVSGRYFVCVFNPGASAVSYTITINTSANLPANFVLHEDSTGSLPIQDDALTRAILNVPLQRLITELQVGVRIDHPRASDLVLHLVSPQGTRVLLAENRGGLSTQGYGSGSGTNMVMATFADNPDLSGVPIKFATSPFTNNLAVVAATNPPVMADGFENATPGLYPAGSYVSGWLVVHGTAEVEGPQNGPDSGNNFLVLGVNAKGASKISTNIVTTPGGLYTISFAYNGGPNDSLAFLTNGVAVKYFQSVGHWYHTSIVFQALSPLTSVELSTLTTGIPAVDSVKVFQNPAAAHSYVLPEEALTSFVGESTLGDWTLEILDDRAGPPDANPALLAWELQFTIAPTNTTTVTLTNCTPYTDVVSGSDFKYFVVDVPRAATRATNILEGTGDLVLYGDQTGLPVGSQPPDSYLVDDNGCCGLGESLLLTTNSPVNAPLRPGQRYYLAVGNFPGSPATNSFSLRVCFDHTDAELFNLTALTNQIPYTNSIPATNALDYYQFTVSSNAVSVSFDLFPFDGDVNLVVRKAQNVVDPLPTTSVFDYASANGGTLPDEVTVVSNSIPVPLSAGVWYLGVYNTTTNTVNYRIVATEITQGIPVITLTNAVPDNSSAGVSSVADKYFKFTVGTNAPVVEFEVYNLTGPADFLIQDGAPPTYSGNYSLAQVSPTLPGKFIVRQSDNFPVIAGDWYLAVINREQTNINYTVRATVLSTNPVFITLTNAIPYTNLVAGSSATTVESDYYQINVATNTKYAEFRLFPISGGVSLEVSNDPTFPSPHYSSANPGPSNQTILVGQGSAPVSLGSGLWYLRVSNLDAPATVYSVRVDEIPTGGAAILPLDGNELSGILAPGAPDYYLLSVPTNGFIFVGIDPSVIGVVNAYLRKGLPYPDAVNFDFKGVENPLGGQVDIDPNNAVGPGDYYLMITNTSSAIIDYGVFASLRIIAPPPNTNFVISPGVSVTNGSVCLTWNSVLNATYTIEAKTNLADANWSVVLTNVIGGSPTTLQCFPETGVDRFFRVVQGAITNPPVVPPPTNFVINPGVTVTNGSVCLTWNSVLNATYTIEAKTNLADANWSVVLTNLIGGSPTTQKCFPETGVDRFFRVVQGAITNPPVVPPPTNFVINPGVTVANGLVCLTWNSVLNATYAIEAKTNLTDASWSVVLTNLIGGSPTTQKCFPETGVDRFFRVVQGSITNPPVVPPSTNLLINPGVTVTTGSVCLTWNSISNATYSIQYKTHLTDAAWSDVATNIVGASSTTKKCFPETGVNGFFRVVQVAAP